MAPDVGMFLLAVFVFVALNAICWGVDDDFG